MNDEGKRKPIKSNIITVPVYGIGNLKVTVEAIELTLQNAERLLDDSKHVSTPTKFALLEIGLEEVSKAWGMIMAFEKISQDKNPDFFKTQFKVAHIDMDKYDSTLKEIMPRIVAFFNKYNPDLFMMPFDSKRWYDHNVKISYLSQLIEYIREIALPLTRASSDRAKAVGDILGRYISKKLDLKEIDTKIDNIFNVNNEQLTEIVKLKESGLYVDTNNDVFISPSSIPFETETLENLLDSLIVMIKGEVKTLLVTLEIINSPKVTKNIIGPQEKKVKIE